MAGTVKLDEYFRTTFEDKLLVKMPEREDDHITPATRLMEKRREMSEVEHALSAQKEEFQMKMESLQQRRAELERKEYQLKESLLKFDKFLKENDSKRTRAIKKANYERDLKKSKDREIIRLNEEITALTKQKVHLLRKLNSYTIYQNFMAKVLEAGEEFHETRDIIARYDTLAATYQDLVETEQKNQDLIEKLRQELMYYSEEKQNEILSYNNKLSTLQIRLDTALSEALKWESKWNRIKNTASKKTLVLGKIKMATHNLYHLVKKHQKQPADSEDTMEQLEQILLFSQDLNNITEEIKHLELAEASLTLPPSR